MMGLRRGPRPSRVRRVEVRPEVEALESVTLLSGGATLKATAASAGQISGQILDAQTSKGIGPIKLQLIDSTGKVVRSTVSGTLGRYSFRVPEQGAYVVREIVPERFKQVAPTFTSSPPDGAYTTNRATGETYSAASWNYQTGNNDPRNGPVGPAAWGSITDVGSLPFQSPINITAAPIDLSPYLSINYQDATPTAIVNNGSQIQTQFHENATDSITLGGTVYELAQFHYHDPSENQVDGATYPMEEHFVNTSASGAETVVAVFLQLGASNPSLQPILDAATAHLKAAGSTYSPTTAVDFAGLLPSNLTGWFYEGSLTTPPLSQVVNWLVLSTPITLSYAQLQQYEAVASGAGFLPNARAIQPLDGRQVNEFLLDLNVQGTSITNANFAIAPIRPAAVSASSIRSALDRVQASSPADPVSQGPMATSFDAPDWAYSPD